jgi:DNA-binding NarL/FixJ family response regulator
MTIDQNNNLYFMIRVLIFEDNPDFIDSLTELIGNTEGIELVGVYNNCRNVLKNVDYHQPDVVLMDIDMPIENGLQGLRNLRAAGNEVIVLMLTVFDDNERVFQAVCHGESGYILKPSVRPILAERP